MAPVMEPLQITAELSDPIVSDGSPIHLDGILSAGVFFGLAPDEKAALPPIGANWAVDLDLPLERWYCDPVGKYDTKLLNSSGQLWGWVASIPLDPWESYGVVEYRKRAPHDEMASRAMDRTVNLGSGPLKSYDLSLPTVWAARQRWYCIGDKKEVYAALQRVHAIGRKHNTGCGSVQRWRVESCDPMECPRIVPTSYAPKFAGYRSEGRIRPPYHHRSRVVTDCWIPISTAMD